MTDKIGRNDPCPCGSGKKYKQCCANSPADFVEPARKGHAGGVERAIEWLTNKHRKAVGAAIGGMLYDELSEEEHDALLAQDQETQTSIQLNATEWLLAEGQILVHGEYRRVAEYLLGHGGPLFTVDQRAWIVQMAERPLRLYDITDVTPNQQLTLCDSLDTEASPIIVREKSGSKASMLGIQMGARIMKLDGHYELSGAAYPFSPLAGSLVVEELRAARDCFDGPAEDLPGILSFIIRRQWLAQFCAPMPMPAFIDAYSGEPMLLITDHYRVRDWTALTHCLSAQSDLDGDRESVWDRLIDCKDGQTRSVATINVENGADKITVFYKTQRYADEGRLWFESAAGKAVLFVSRELSDPAGLLRNMPVGQRVQPADAGLDMSPEALAEMIEETLRRMYAKWPDEPIPALANKTPRQAINTATGLERVKGLIRMYEAGEKRQAAEQGRRTISFDFLWQALGISR
ncbi:SEC-C metal-binding domain-containing protein [Candidatus Accumulibacter sp. ACC003]|uniref:SEC-C metal-binding domain-containing protein n=1 Tax=Candidatus Accumulibacter sp. ACC003 TaxID=2823334 RepID=UPI0025B93DB0|nr:SEC-C metal-binding domain-containing protein [Candidatus Accumulibacter sp. ACC003]